MPHCESDAHLPVDLAYINTQVGWHDVVVHSHVAPNRPGSCSCRARSAADERYPVLDLRVECPGQPELAVCGELGGMRNDAWCATGVGIRRRWDKYVHGAST
jgi:hypothetical protein